MWKQKAEQHWLVLKLQLSHLVSAFCKQIQIEWFIGFVWHIKVGKVERGKMIEEIKSPNLSKAFFMWVYKVNPTFIHLCSKKGMVWFTWVDRCECKCYYASKVSFLSQVLKEHLLVEPLNHSTFACRHSLKCKWKIQKARDFSLAQTSVWFNLVKAHPVFLSYIYMCICRLYTHIYSRYTCTVCIVTYIWFNGSKLLSRGYKKTSEQQA